MVTRKKKGAGRSPYWGNRLWHDSEFSDYPQGYAPNRGPAQGGLESPGVKENENATCEQCKKLFMRKIGSSRSKCYNCSPLGKYKGEDVTQGISYRANKPK